jgi:hypothetical protein
MPADEQLTLGQEIIAWIETTRPGRHPDRSADRADGLATGRDPEDVRQPARDEAVHHFGRSQIRKDDVCGQ